MCIPGPVHAETANGARWSLSPLAALALSAVVSAASCAESNTMEADATPDAVLLDVPVNSDTATPWDAGAHSADRAAPDSGSARDTGDEVDAGALPPQHDGSSCGFESRGRLRQIAPQIEVCEPEVVCTAETCPPPLGDCVQGRCQYRDDYAGLATLPQAWATHYCDLPGGGCHGVTQVEFAEVTAAEVSTQLGAPGCYEAPSSSTRCVGIMAAPPMMVGNSQEAVDPATGQMVALWGQGMTEASGFCYRVTGPGGTAVLAVTDRCGGYCRCNGSGFQECGPCVSAADMEPNCACVGSVPGLYDSCCGLTCPTLQNDCDWCASNNHPHFDLDTASFNWVCGAEAGNGSCQLSAVEYIPCIPPRAWPPGGSSSCPPQSFVCPDGSPAPEQPQIPGTSCCCNWGLTPQPNGECA